MIMATLEHIWMDFSRRNEDITNMSINQVVQYQIMLTEFPQNKLISYFD